MINDIHFENFPSLESERLLFRKFELSDAADIHSLRSNEQVMKYMDAEGHETILDSENFIHRNFDSYEAKNAIAWAIIEKEEGRFVGDFSFWRIIRENHRAELGYTLKPQFWNKGFMTEAMKCILKFGFNELNLHSMEADINPDNESSRNVLLKMGFKKAAYFRENRFFNGKHLDSEIYDLIGRDFKVE